MSRAHDPLLVDPVHTVAPEFVSVAYTRAMVRFDGAGAEILDGAEAARHGPSAVELRVDVPGCGAFTAEEVARIVAFRALQADRRGVVRVTYGEGETRPKNLVGARKRMADLMCEAMQTPLPPAVTERPRRGRAGLIKAPRG
jgi:hypothetical protein